MDRGRPCSAPCRLEATTGSSTGVKSKGFSSHGAGPVSVWVSRIAVIDIDGRDNIVLRNIDVDCGILRQRSQPNFGNVQRDQRIVCGQSSVNRIDARDFADDGVQAHFSDDLIIAHSKIHGGFGAGTDGAIDGPCFNGHSDGIELMNKTDRALILGNMIYNVVNGTGPLIVQDAPPTSEGNALNMAIVNNIFYGPTTGLVASLQHIDGLTFHNNVVWGTADPDRQEASRAATAGLGSMRPQS